MANHSDHYAHYNDAYKNCRALARVLGLTDREVFEAAGMQVTGSQLKGWQAGPQHKNFRIIKEPELLAFIDGLNVLAKKHNLKIDRESRTDEELQHPTNSNRD